jgi:hypothetical protein
MSWLQQKAIERYRAKPDWNWRKLAGRENGGFSLRNRAHLLLEKDQ